MSEKIITRECEICGGPIPWAKTDWQARYNRKTVCRKNCFSPELASEAKNRGLEPIPGYPGYYASQGGDIFSTRLNNRLIKKTIVYDPQGYRKIHIFKENKKEVQLKVSNLVALAFFGPRPKNMIIRHLDDNKENDSVSNLAYGTHRENTDDALRNNKWPKGDRHGCAKLNSIKVRKIKRLLLNGLTSTEIAKIFDVTHSTISCIKRNKTWKEVLP